MTFGSSSAIFTQALLNPMLGRLWTTAAPTTFANLSADTIKVALFNNTTTPDKEAAVASTGFNTGVWITANEVTDATNWVSGGRALSVGKAFAAGTGIVNFDANDLSGAGNVTIANAYGDLTYDDTITGGTVADQGLCYHAYGAAQGVTAGTFTIVWDSTGVFKVTN
jgi:hypothetical protein